jgi:hypothetical protein
MKRTHDSLADIPQDLYVTNGCVCYTGQGYSPCECPSSVEVTKEDFDRRKAWTFEDVKAFVKQQKTRAVGRYVAWHSYIISGPADKAGNCGALLRKWDMLEHVIMNDGKPLEHTVAFFLNGDFRFWRTTNLEAVLDQFDRWEGVCRSRINAAIFVDGEAHSIHCVDENKASWKDLVAPNGSLAQK